MKKLCVALLLAAGSSAFAAQYSLNLKPEATDIRWTLSDVLHTVHGTFRLQSGRIEFDNETGRASGRVAVDVTSGNSGSHERDSRMHANVLESKKFPEAVFTPDRFEGKLALPGVSSLKVHGVLKIHGASHEITMDVQTRTLSETVNAAISFDIPYVAWGMRDPSNFLLKVSKSVQVSVQAAGTLTAQ